MCKVNNKNVRMTPMASPWCLCFSSYLGFTSCKAEQSLRGIELQEKEAQKDGSTEGIRLERT